MRADDRAKRICEGEDSGVLAGAGMGSFNWHTLRIVSNRPGGGGHCHRDPEALTLPFAGPRQARCTPEGCLEGWEVGAEEGDWGRAVGGSGERL